MRPDIAIVDTRKHYDRDAASRRSPTAGCHRSAMGSPSPLVSPVVTSCSTLYGGRRDHGAALVFALVLLIVTTLLALSAYQSSLSSERVAGNYREYVLALNEAEAGVADFFRALRAPDTLGFTFENLTGDDALTALIEAATQATQRIEDANDGDRERALRKANAEFEVANVAWEPGSLHGGLGSYRWQLRAYHPSQTDAGDSNLSGSGFWLTSEGRFGQRGHQARRMVRVLFTIPGATTFPFEGIMTCEGMTISGSGIIDSYNSFAGSYGINDNSRGNKVLIASQVSDMPVTLAGSAPVFGHVKASGDVVATGSAPVIGDIMANGDVDIRGENWWYEERQENGRVFGNIQATGNVIANGTTHGNVESNERIELNWGSKVRGNVTADEIDLPYSSNLDDVISGIHREVAGGAAIAPLPSVATAAECDTLNVDDWITRKEFTDIASSGTLLLDGRERDVVLSANGLHDPNGPLDVAVGLKEIDGQTAHIARFDSFSLEGHVRFVIGTADRPVDMIMVIDRETNIGGGGFIISKGSTLRIVTSGQFNLGSGITVSDEKPTKRVNDKTVPIFSVVSNYRDSLNRGNSKSGVLIGGASAFFGQVIAPYSKVDIHGSGDMFGAINARKAEISGAGGFHYDENFSNLPGFEGNDDPGIPQLKRVMELVSP